jgi:hypothetical protein
MFSLTNDFCFRYQFSQFCDQYHNFSEKNLTSYKLETLVFYFENDETRYELCKVSNKKITNYQLCLYRWSSVKYPFSKNNNVPLLEKELNVLFKDILWNEIIFGLENIIIKSKEFYVKKFYPLEIKNK